MLERVWRKGNTFTLLVGMQTSTATMENSVEIKKTGNRTALWRKVKTNLNSMSKSRDSTLPTKVRIVKAMVFPLVKHKSESLTIKKAERRTTDVFQLWCWRRLLRVPCTARRSNKSILKEITLNIHWKLWCWSSNTLATFCKPVTNWKRYRCWKRLKT